MDKRAHGHIVPNPDGYKEPCGGVSVCSQCQKEYETIHGDKNWDKSKADECPHSWKHLRQEEMCGLDIKDTNMYIYDRFICSKCHVTKRVHTATRKGMTIESKLGLK